MNERIDNYYTLLNIEKCSFYTRDDGATRDKNENVSEDVKRNHEKKDDAYRVTPAQYQAMTRITDLLFKNGSIKINSRGELARAAAFTHNNIFLQIAAKEKAYKEYEAELHKRRIRPMRSCDYVPQPGSY